MTDLPPLVRRFDVPCPPDEAFETFLSGMGRWWPMEKFSTSAFRGVPSTLEVAAQVGGEIVEVAEDGARVLWGTIETLEPPHRMSMRFHIPHPDEVVTARTLVELTFTATQSGTRVQLSQSEWESLGKLAKPLHGGYGGGWAVIFDGAYADACTPNNPNGD